MHSLHLYRRLLSIQIRAQLQYRVSFIMEVFASGVTLAMWFVAIAFVLQRFDNIGGWQLAEIAFLYGLIEFSFGLMDMMFGGFDPRDFGQEVRRGTFDRFLLRPVNITLQVLGSAFFLRRLGRIAQGGVILFIALFSLDIDWTLGKILYLPLLSIGQIAFFASISVFGSTIAFWTIESIEAVNILTYGTSDMVAFPMHIYPNWMIRFFTYIVPAIFINYYPALFILDKTTPLAMPSFAPFIAPLVGFVMLWLSFRFWHFGIRHYQSTGT